jgi:hypothetical protein
MLVVGGHPHLLRAVLVDLIDGRYTLEDLAVGWPSGRSLVADHLRHHRTRLDADPGLAAAFGMLVRDPKAKVDAVSLDALIHLGLISRVNGGAHRPRYYLYERLTTAASAPAMVRKRRVFYSYSHRDERYRDRLEVHLKLLEREGLIESWHDRRLLPGSDWSAVISEHLDASDIIILLLTADFLASEYCSGFEVERALERHQQRRSVVVPVLVQPCDWKTAPFAKLQTLPQDGNAVMRWNDPEHAWADVAQGIRRLITDWPLSAGASPPSPFGVSAELVKARARGALPFRRG